MPRFRHSLWLNCLKPTSPGQLSRKQKDRPCARAAFFFRHFRVRAVGEGSHG